ncbi:hypothetical protein [Saccharopolyspora shandongensis]
MVSRCIAEARAGRPRLAAIGQWRVRHIRGFYRDGWAQDLR